MAKKTRAASLTIAFLSAGLACWATLHIRGCNRIHYRDNHLAFDVSPSGDRIVFTGAGNGERDLYTLNLKSYRVARLTDTSDYESDPAFSPDGATLAYVTGVAETGDRADHLFTRSLDGGTVQQLTNEDFNDQSPAFSPDGTEIVFLRADYYMTGGMVMWGTWGNPQIHIVRRDGTGLRQITDSRQLLHSPLLTAVRRRTPPSRTGFNEVRGYDMGSPQFAPDGKTLVFDIGDTPYGNRHDIASIDLSRNANNWSQGLHLLTNDGKSVIPTIAPDGMQIAFVSKRSTWGGEDRDGRLSELQFMKHNGSARKDIGAAMKHISVSSDRLKIWTRARFSPDGKYLYFLASRDGLWRMDANGRNLTQIADDTLFASPLSWQAQAPVN